MFSCISIFYLRVIFLLNNLFVFILFNFLEKYVEIFIFFSVVYKLGFIFLCVLFNNKIYIYVYVNVILFGGDLFNMK